MAVGIDSSTRKAVARRHKGAPPCLRASSLYDQTLKSAQRSLVVEQNSTQITLTKKGEGRDGSHVADAVALTPHTQSSRKPRRRTRRARWSNPCRPAGEACDPTRRASVEPAPHLEVPVVPLDFVAVDIGVRMVRQV